MIWWGNFEAEGVSAIYEEGPGGGDPDDFNSPFNAPAKSPHEHLSRVYWHSSFFQYELVAPVLTKEVTHAALAGLQRWSGIAANNTIVNNVTTAPAAAGAYIRSVGQVRATDIVLLEHGLPYVPMCFVAYEGRILSNGVNVQNLATGQGRLVSAFANETVIGIREMAFSTAAALPAAVRNYEVLVLRNPMPDPLKPMFAYDGDHLTIGRGIVDSDKAYVRTVLAGESSFDLDLGRSIDIKAGRTKYVSGGIATTETGYTGSFAGSPFKPIGV